MVCVPNDDDSILPPEEALEASSVALFTGWGVAASQNPVVAANPTLLAIIPAVATILGVAFTRFGKRIVTKRLPKWVDGFGKAFKGEPEKVKEHVEQHKDDDDYHETVYRSFRLMVDAADPEVVPVLGYMAGEYTKHGKKADAFFRGFGRLLCELEAGELAELKALLEGVEDANRQCNDEWIDVAIDSDLVSEHELPPEPGQHPNFKAFREEYEEVVKVVLTSDSSISVGKFPSASRLFLLLKRESLAENKSPLDMTGEPAKRLFPLGDLAMLISAETVRKILASISAAQPGEVGQLGSD